MGCMASSVPDVIIPDPEEGQKCHVLFKKTGMMAKDQNVFQDCDKEKKWLLLDKEGGLWSNPTYILENFVRKEGEKRGQCLCAAKLEIAELKVYGHDVHEDSDSSEDDSDDDDDGVEVNVEVVKMKWAQKIKVKFYTDRDRKDKIAEIKVKAKGKGKRTTTTTTIQDDEGNEVSSSSVQIEKKVKKVKYIIEELKGHDEPPKIKLEGKPNKNAYKLKWEGDVFQAEIDSNGWGSQEIEVKTDFKNPSLGMLMGYIVAKEISPDDIKDNVNCW